MAASISRRQRKNKIVLPDSQSSASLKLRLEVSEDFASNPSSAVLKPLAPALAARVTAARRYAVSSFWRRSSRRKASSDASRSSKPPLARIMQISFPSSTCATARAQSTSDSPFGKIFATMDRTRSSVRSVDVDTRRKVPACVLAKSAASKPLSSPISASPAKRTMLCSPVTSTLGERAALGESQCRSLIAQRPRRRLNALC